MSWQWTAAGYAAAGAVAAMVPVAFHLLRRRHVRQVEWGPMFLLRQAVTRQRRWMRLRDRLLLALRMLAVVAFGCALARPRPTLSGNNSLSEPSTHLIFIDNSLSMGYRHLGAARIELALEKAKSILDQLPSGARAMVLPVCDVTGSGGAVRWLRPSEIRLRPNDFPLVDQRATAARLGRRIESLAAYVSPPAHRIYLVSDQQALNWSDDGTVPIGAQPPIQLVDVGADGAANAWVQRVEVSPAVLIAGQGGTVHAEIAASGSNLAPHTSVSLLVEGESIAQRTIETPASGRSVSVNFPLTAEQLPSASMVDGWLEVTVRISADLLSEDDQWQTLIPLLHSAAIICVDQRADDRENPAQAEVGSTFPLRRLLSAFGRPVAAHVTPEQLDASLLRGARVVVVAGVPPSAPLVSLLREFVVDGGQLLIAAGGDFDPQAWNDQAWLGGRGILPVPLAGAVQTFTPPQRLDWKSMERHSAFRLPGLTPNARVQLANEPLILQSLSMEVPEQDGAAAQDGPGRPTLLARLESGTPLLVERTVGRGRVVLMGTSFEPTWNTWATSNAVLLWEGMVGDMLRRTLDERQFTVGQGPHLVVPAAATGGEVPSRWQLVAPAGESRELTPRASGEGGAVVQIPTLWRRGIYRLRPSSATGWDQALRFAVEPSSTLPAESDLTRLSLSVTETQANRKGSAPPIVQAQLGGDWAWWYLVCLMLGLLILEMALLGFRRRGNSSDLEMADAAGGTPW